MSFPSCEEIHRRFRYDERSGRIVRITSPGGGVPAGAPVSVEWAAIDGKKHATKKVAWVLHHNEAPPEEIWFADSNPTNISKENLEDRLMRAARRYKPPRDPKEQKRRSCPEVRKFILDTYHYDPATGKVTAKNYYRKVHVGQEVGSVTSRGYVRTKIKGAEYLMHRIIWVIQTGDWPPMGLDPDHINRVRSDNRWENLRLATHTENMRNRSPHRKRRLKC